MPPQLQRKKDLKEGETEVGAVDNVPSPEDELAARRKRSVEEAMLRKRLRKV
jgi:hypothetical protein